MGSPQFAVPTLIALIQNYNVVGVVTQPDRPAGRNRKLLSPAVKKTAQEFGLPIIQPTRLSDKSTSMKIVNWSPDIIVVTAYGQILKEPLLELPPYGCVNVHASLLPRWRGAAPIQAAILNGDNETGITIMKMDTGLDTGPIYSQHSIPIKSNDNAATLGEKLSHLGANLLIETLPNILNNTLTPKTQDDSLATYAPRLSKKDAELDFNKSSEEIINQVRAFFGWPGAYMFWNNAMLKIIQASVYNIDCQDIQNKKPGTRIVVNKKPAVITKDGCIILEEVKPAGKKNMPGETFLRGARSWISQ